jgi:hypothetical protein
MRCSEKDLYDLKWLFGAFPSLQIDQLLAEGAHIDGGVTAEAVLLSLVTSPLRKSACAFSLRETEREVFQSVAQLKETLAHALDLRARREPLGPIADLIRTLKPRTLKPPTLKPRTLKP